MSNKGRDYFELYYKIKDLEDKGKTVTKILSDQLSRYECEVEDQIYWESRFLVRELFEKFQRYEIDIPTFHGQFLTLYKDVLNLLNSEPLIGFLHLQDNVDPKSKIFASRLDDLYTTIMDWDWTGESFSSIDEDFDDDELKEASRQSKIVYREIVMDMFTKIEKLFESEQ